MASNPYANVFAAFSKGLAGEAPPEPTTPAATQGAADSLQILNALKVIQSAGGAIAFARLADTIRTDAIGNLSVVMALVQEGLVEFGDELTPSSVIRLTPRGQDMLGVLSPPAAAAAGA